MISKNVCKFVFNMCFCSRLLRSSSTRGTKNKSEVNCILQKELFWLILGWDRGSDSLCQWLHLQSVEQARHTFLLLLYSIHVYYVSILFLFSYKLKLYRIGKLSVIYPHTPVLTPYLSVSLQSTSICSIVSGWSGRLTLKPSSPSFSWWGWWKSRT